MGIFQIFSSSFFTWTFKVQTLFFCHFVARESETSSGDVCDIGRHVDMLGIWVWMEDWIDFHVMQTNMIIQFRQVQTSHQPPKHDQKRFQKKLFIQIRLTTENCECHKMSKIFLKIYSYISIYIYIQNNSYPSGLNRNISQSFPTQMCWEPTRLKYVTLSQKITKHTASWAPLNHRPRTRSLDWNCQRTNGWNFTQQLMIWVDVFPFPRGLFSGSRCGFIWGIYIPTFVLS